MPRGLTPTDSDNTSRLTMRPLLASLSALLLAPVLLAAPLSTPVRAEIEVLLSTLQSSGCEFNRNDSWHTAAEARTHLLRKLDYLDGNNAVQSTEQFIELGASKSSLSGQPYRVKCGAAAAVDSKTWLSDQLKLIRASSRVMASSSK